MFLCSVHSQNTKHTALPDGLELDYHLSVYILSFPRLTGL
jgi:hypothetical protein